MAKIGINGSGIKRRLGNFLSHPAFVIPAGVATIVLGLAGLAAWAAQPTEEEILVDQLNTEVLSIYEDGKTYTLINEDIVRVDEGDLTFDFHFSSGDIYVQANPEKHAPDGQDAVFTNVTLKNFNEIARPAWVNEVRAIGCSIANAPMEFNGTELIEAEIIIAKDSANGFLELHCNG